MESELNNKFLPWMRIIAYSSSDNNLDILPAHYTVQYVLEEIFSYFERRLNHISEEETVDKPLNKSIRRGEESYFLGLLRTLNGLCETCLPSILTAFLKWYDHQQKVSLSDIGETRDRAIKKTLTASYLFSIVLIEILPQIHFHPTDCESQINFIITTSFKQISYKDPAMFGNTYNNSLLVAEIFAEVIGVLSQSHTKQIEKTFLDNLNEFRKEPTTPATIRAIVCLLMGMKYYRVKTNQISSLEQGIAFLDEIGSYYLEVDLKQKDLKHALAGLLVEILLPLAAQIKTEANVPALIALVDKLYGPTYDLVNKKQHKMAAYPLLTCLLCISQNKFFLSTWVQFLNLSLANLKNKDPKISRMALESLYRLIWVYIIRISCEGNSVTRSRLESICGSLFPRGSRNVVPRDAPLNIFVKIIHFIAQYKIDFAFKEIIYDLLGCCSRSTSRTLSIYPERMNIGIRALMVIVDGLQQKESPPGMPRPIVPLYGTVQRTKRSYLTQPLSSEIARSLGLEQYFSPCRKAFDAILRTLDAQIGRPYMLTAPHVRSKDYNEVLGAELKAKFDLFRTCIAAIPRLLPDPMPYQDLIEFLIRMCVHVDEEIRLTAYQSLQNLMTECQEWREDGIHIFLRFFTNQIQDTFPTLLESMVRLLLQLLCIWKSSLHLENQKKINGLNKLNKDDSKIDGTPHIQNGGNNVNKTTIGMKMLNNKMTSLFSHSSNLQDEMTRSIISNYSINNSLTSSAFAIHCLEGLGICLLCQLRSQTKRMAISILYEAKHLLELLTLNKQHETPVIDVLEEAMPDIIEKYLPHVDEIEKRKWSRDLFTFCEQVSNLEPNSNLVNEENGNEYFRWDPWACVLSGYCQHRFLLSKCTIAISFAWPALLLRFNQCNQIIDPNNPQNESRSSLLRSSKSKASNWPLCGEILSHENYLSLWQKYIVLVYGLMQSSSTVLPNLMQFRSFSPSISGTDTTEVNRSMISSVRMTRTASLNCSQLIQRASVMIRWEPTDIRDSIVLGIGSINPESFEMLLEEFNSKGIFREANERKNESNLRRKKRKELLRLQLLRIIEVAIYRGLLDYAVFDRHSGSLTPLILEFIEAIRFHVEMEMNRDLSTNMRLHFAKVITQMVKSVPLDLRENLIPWDLRRTLFFLFFSWCSRTIAASSDKKKDSDVGIFVEQKAIQAMCALSSIGNIFENHDSSIGEDYIFRWLEALLASNNSTVNNLCEELLCTILHLNENHPQIFERIVQMCYLKGEPISSRCFRALALLFSQRDYPCEFISLLCLCGTFISDSESVPMRQTAFHFIQLLRQQFLDDLSFSSPNVPLFAETMQEQENNKKRMFSMSQTTISQQLSNQYTQLTMPIFSEICLRIESARPNMQSSMLCFFKEWIKNICLMVAHCDIRIPETSENVDGWGSEEATQLLLNNLIYLTAKLANEHDQEIGDLWKCLASESSSNLAIIVHFLMVMMTLSLDNMLPLVKRISGYIFQATDEHYIRILIEELQNVGIFFKLQLCRSEMPPYYRWLDNNGSKEVLNLSEDADTNILDESNESNSKMQPSSCTKTTKQLPMPPYGGNYSRLSTMLPSSTQTIQPLERGKLALFLLCDLLALESTNPFNWEAHLPKLLHMAMINLDSNEPITCFHARQTIINIIFMFGSNNVPPFQLAITLIKNQLRNSNTSNESKFNEMGSINMRQNRNNINESSSLANESVENSSFISRGGTMPNHQNYKEQILEKEALFPSRMELLKALLFTLSFEQFTPLWDHEETTQRIWVTESSKRMERFMQHLVSYLIPTISDLATNWTNFAIDFALKTSKKHFASRSFQISGILSQNPAPYIGQIVSRLVEIIADNSDEMQSYIIDMFKCLQKMAQFNSRVASVNGHCRSISYTPNLILDSPSQLSNLLSESSTNKMEKKDMRHSLLLGNEFLSPQTESKKCFLIRSKSATTLKLSDNANVMSEEDLETFTRILLVTLALLESNLDNEFLIGLHTLDKLFYICGSQRLECLIRLEKIISQYECAFPGIIPIVLRGILYHPNGYETTLSVFTKCIPYLSNKIVCTDSNQTFGLVVVASLPYCIQHFNSPNQLCSNLAQSIATHCQIKLNEIMKNNNSAEINLDHPLNNLITMMGQYREHSFPRDYSQWVKCVVNYLLDSLTLDTFQLILVLSEMLDRTPIQFHSTILDILLLLFTFGNLSDSPPIQLNSQVVRLISKHIHGSNSREASRILKLIVDHWNSISVNLVNNNEKKLLSSRKPDFELHFEKSTREINIPKTMMDGNFKQRIREKLISLFALCGVPIGSTESHHFLQPSTNENATMKQQDDKRTLSRNEAAQYKDGPEQIQTQLHPKDEFGLERMSSPNSLGPTIDNSGANSELVSLRTTDSFPRVFKEFDFLEAEHDSISESTDSCFNWLSTMRTPRVCSGNENDEAIEGKEDVPDDDEEYYEEDDDLDSNNTKRSDNFSSPSFGGGGGRSSIESVESMAARRAQRNAFGGNKKKRELMPIRPMSGASDSNDISSDRTPIQSTHHSDESSSSSYISEEEETRNQEERNEIRQSSSEGTQEESSSNRRPQNSNREGEDGIGGNGKKLSANVSSSATSSTKSPPIQMASIILANQMQPQQLCRPSNASSLVSLSLQTSSTTTHPHLFEINQFRSNSIGTPRLDRQQFFSQDQGTLILSLRLECGHHISGIVEQLWNSSISRGLEDDRDGEITSNSIMLFTQLLRENGTRLVGLLRDSLDTCRQMDAFRQQMNARGDISAQLGHTLSMCIKLADCPFLFISSHFLRSSNLLVAQKFALFELREHFDTFAEHREHTLRALNMVKSSQKLLLINNENSSNTMTMGDAAPAVITPSLSSSSLEPVNQQFGIRKQELALFKSLHKLCFQLLIILEKLIDMVQTVHHSTNSQESDLTPAVASLQRELLGHLSNSAAPSSSVEPFNPSGGMIPSNPSLDLCQSRDTLMLHTTNKQFRNAFNKVKQLRIQYSNGGQFGCCEQTDVDVLLLNFCRSHCSLRMWALVGASLEQLRSWCGHLKESNVQLGILVRNTLVQSQSNESITGNGPPDSSQQTLMENFM